MNLSLFLFKLTATPLLIALVTLIGRRWGPAVSGWFIGFPFVSAPISLVLALQYGPAFAARAGLGSLGGQSSVCLYCLVYCLVAARANWPLSVAAALAAFMAVTFGWNLLHPGLLATLAINLAVVLVVLRLLPRPAPPAAALRPPPWDIPARMAITAAFVLGLTALAGMLGPQLSGLLAMFPVFTSIMAPFTHYQQGAAAAIHLLRGLVLGSVAFVAFYLAIVLLLPAAPLGWAYLAAAAASIAANVAVLRLARRPTPQAPREGGELLPAREP